MTPRIAIPVPTSRNVSYNELSWPAYARAVTLSGGEPVAVGLELPVGTLRELIASCDGVLLPGSPADVDPGLYGAERDPATAGTDGAREAVDTLLLEDAERHGKPVLGVCFGVQSLNVWRGGTLVQDLTPMPVNHSAGASVAIAHTALVTKDSLLGSLLTEQEAPEVDGFLRLPVNTSHHQAVGTPGDGLRIVARSLEDGVIEAVEGAVEMSADDSVFHVEHPAVRQLVLGVQWHPERSFEISAASRALFGRLVEEARRVAGDGAESVAESEVR